MIVQAPTLLFDNWGKLIRAQIGSGPGEYCNLRGLHELEGESLLAQDDVLIHSLLLIQNGKSAGASYLRDPPYSHWLHDADGTLSNGT